METALIEFVNQAGGEMDTSNDDKKHDSIYAFVWSEYDEAYIDCKVVRVRTESNRLIIKVDYPLSEEKDGEYWIFGGLVLINATLYNLCECLTQYKE